jgi:NitT/TauT family transport system ATP-binding protein
MNSIKLNSVRKSFVTRTGSRYLVFENLSHLVAPDCFTSIIGPNGSGKSTLLNLVAGLALPDAGTIELPKPNVSTRRIGYVWQDYRSSLLPWLNVIDNVTFPLRLEGVEIKERRRIGRETLAKFMPDIDPTMPSYQLSGGQQQLVCLARSSCAHPDVLLWDEPFSALDQHRSWRMAAYVEQLWNERPVPTLFVSHDIDEGILLADEIVLLSKKLHGIAFRLRNSLPRPRTIEMLTSTEHLQCRKKVIEFFYDVEGSATERPDRDFSQLASIS